LDVREVAFFVIDLNEKSWPQLLDVDHQINHYLPKLAENLGMPGGLNYVLIPKGMQLALDGRHSLAQYRIPAGAELYVRPLRDHLLQRLLDRLYDQIKDEIKGQMIDAAKEKLKQILHLDPSYPDPFNYKEQFWGAIRQGQLPNMVGQQVQYQNQPKSPSFTGWIIAGVLGGSAALFVLGTIVTAILVLPTLLKASNGIPPAVNNEPVLGTGDVQVTLRWDTPVDLDLHVTDPAGEEIWYDNKLSTSGGNLDVDANGGCNTMIASPVENVFWPYGGAPSGQYQVSVVYFSNCYYSGPVNYQVTIKQNNRVVNTLTGTVNVTGESQFVTSFDR
jgi:hypothetical protein